MKPIKSWIDDNTLFLQKQPSVTCTDRYPVTMIPMWYSYTK